MNTYKYQTDSASGTFDSATFEDAIRMLHDVLTDEAMSDGASGWVENTENGTVYLLCTAFGGLAGDADFPPPHKRYMNHQVKNMAGFRFVH